MLIFWVVTGFAACVYAGFIWVNFDLGSAAPFMAFGLMALVLSYLRYSTMKRFKQD